MVAIRLEDRLVQLVSARPLSDRRNVAGSAQYELTFDHEVAPPNQSFLSGHDPAVLAEALEALSERHPLRRAPLAVSLDGDFCVTRVTVTSADRMARALASLNERIGHYLQLGPGNKVTGSTEVQLDESSSYAATAVVNEQLIETIYVAFQRAKVQIAWVEPSLISLARLTGRDQRFRDSTVMIADGTGQRWDIGIAGEGRLWLDYRPAGADSREGFFRALDGHLERLQRFCFRHRRLDSGEMTELLVCGKKRKAEHALELLRQLDGVRACVYTPHSLDALLADTSSPAAVPLPGNCDLPAIGSTDRTDSESPTTRTMMSDQAITPELVPVVAALLPTMIGTRVNEVPDMLASIRRAAPRTAFRAFAEIALPWLAATLVVAASMGYRQTAETSLSAAQRSMGTIESDANIGEVHHQAMFQRANLIANLQSIVRQTETKNPMQAFDQIAMCLPPNTRLTSYVMTVDGTIKLQGESRDESMLYQVIETLQTIPNVSEVNLESTEPGETEGGSLFVIAMQVKS